MQYLREVTSCRTFLWSCYASTYIIFLTLLHFLVGNMNFLQGHGVAIDSETSGDIRGVHIRGVHIRVLCSMVLTEEFV